MSKKNILFFADVEIPQLKLTRKDYNADVFKIGIKSFTNWAKQYSDIEVIVLSELIHDHDYMKVNFQRYYVFDLLENEGIDYDQILISDADCIIHPDCPNFFELSEHKYTVTQTVGSMDWVLRSYETYSKYLFNDQQFPWYKYFNAGFQIVNKNHKFIFKDLIDLYHSNSELIRGLQTKFGVGTDQPVINFLANLSGVDMKFLPYEFCMTDLYRMEILGDDMMFANKFKGIYQFNCLPSHNGVALAGDVHYWMQKTYNYLYK